MASKRSKTTCVEILRGVVVAGCLVAASPASAQLNGENLLGDVGVKSGTQPEPGVYVSTIYYRYFADTVKGPDGKVVRFDPTQSGSQTIHAGVPLVLYVSSKKLFGANYGMMAVMPFANGSLEAPGLGLSESASTGPSDLYVMPLQLGWHLKRADITTGVAMFAPTGRHTSGASDNLGKGMWSYEVSGGTTLYLDEGRSLSVATTAYWETHTKKDGELRIGNATVTDIKVGQLLTLEGGVGKSFLHGAAGVGLAYYAQWKLTSDQMSLSPSLLPGGAPDLDKHRVVGFGPDVTIPIATKSRLIALVNARYFWETGADLKTQGQTLMLTTTIPIGGIRIPGK
jgi:hypothetical protein